jgi:hypothetical protein
MPTCCSAAQRSSRTASPTSNLAERTHGYDELRTALAAVDVAAMAERAGIDSAASSTAKGCHGGVGRDLPRPRRRADAVLDAHPYLIRVLPSSPTARRDGGCSSPKRSFRDGRSGAGRARARARLGSGDPRARQLRDVLADALVRRSPSITRACGRIVEGLNTSSRPDSARWRRRTAAVSSSSSIRR